MSKVSSNTYSEVYSYLNALGEEFIERIPEEKYREIIERKDNNYIPKYHIDDFEDETTISKEAKSIIAFYHINYWCDSKEERNQIIKILDENEKKLMEKYEPFKNKQRHEIQTEENKQLVEIKKKGIIDIIRGILRKIKNRE